MAALGRSIPRRNEVDSGWLIADSLQVASARRPASVSRETGAHHCLSIQEAEMSVHELTTLARKHWKAHLPDKVKELQAEGTLEAAINGAANLAQSEIETLMKAGYQEHEAREVALPMFI